MNLLLLRFPLPARATVPAATALLLSLASHPARLVGQQAEHLQASAATTVRTLDLDGIRVPIHTQNADPHGGDYGVWAAGRDFKVAFAAGRIELHPAGADGRAWTWTTESIGGRPVTAAARATAPTRFTTARFETRHDSGVVEAYDLQADGVEQSFVFPTRPETQGDLQVVGRVESPWFATESAGDGRHDELWFHGVETTGVRYGEAFALDAAGRRLAIPTRWDGSRITLTVPRSFVDSARYPLVIDPLVGPRTVHWNGTNRNPVRSVDIARDDQTDRIFVAVTEEPSGRDRDLLLYRCGDDFSNPQLVFADITTSWSTEQAHVATVGGARKCVTAFHRVFGDTKHSLRWHTRTLTDTRLSSAYGYLAGPSGEHDWQVDVGGSRAFASGDHALIVWQRDLTGGRFQNTASSQAMYALLDVSGTGQGVLSTERRLRNIGYDQESPRATPLAEGGTNSGWPVVWQEWGALRRGGRAWDGIVRRVNIANGGVLSTGIGVLRTPENVPTHCLRPSIAGERGRYLVLYAASRESQVNGKTPFPQGHTLATERIDWTANSTQPSFPHPATTLLDRGDRRYASGSIGFDSDSRSHWAATAADTIADFPFVYKLGYRGRKIDSELLATASHADPVPGGVSFDDDNDRFTLCIGRLNPQTLGWAALGYLFTYGAANPPSTYGVACTTATPGWDGTWYVGDEFAAVTLTNAPSRAAAVLRFSSVPRQTALDYLGMPGCLLHLDIGRMWSLSVAATTSTRGGVRVPLALQEQFIPQQIFLQWFLLEPGANQLGVTATSGLGLRLVR